MSANTPPARIHQHPLKLSTSVILMVSAMLISVLLVVHLFYYIQLSQTTRDNIQHNAQAIARTLASMPEIQQALQHPPPEHGDLQRIASEIQKRNDLLFVVITNMQGVRYSHPNQALINQVFIGDDIQPALLGHENVAVNHGVLAEALRVFTPIYDDHGQQSGVVAIGVSLADIDRQLAQSRGAILRSGLFGVLIGILGTVMLVKTLKRMLFGLEPYEISSLFEQRQAMLQAMKEGVLAVDCQGRITLINEAAQQIIGYHATETLQAIKSTEGYDRLNVILQDVLNTHQPCTDEEICVNGHLLLTNTVPVSNQHGVIGAVCSFRDKTEISQLLQRLDGMENYADALRVRSHEFMNKLHVILGLLHIKHYARLEEYILHTANSYQTEIGSLLQKIQSPVIAGFVLSKMTSAAERGHTLSLSEESEVPDDGDQEQMNTVITVVGNLIENAIEALAEQPGSEINLLLHYRNGKLTCVVSDEGPGIVASMRERIFERGFSTKGEHRGVGLSLAREQVMALGGTLYVESEPEIYTQFFMQIPWGGRLSDE
ncbi:MAG: Sensor histidine kinase DcuS [Candidatus Erwinia impunctatus]|nr:Sensor histidine kinase DcuS [Culicoides impunctatus]